MSLAFQIDEVLINSPEGSKYPFLLTGLNSINQVNWRFSSFPDLQTGLLEVAMWMKRESPSLIEFSIERKHFNSLLSNHH